MVDADADGDDEQDGGMKGPLYRRLGLLESGFMVDEIQVSIPVLECMLLILGCEKSVWRGRCHGCDGMERR